MGVIVLVVVDQVVAAGDDNGAADDIAEGDRQKIMEQEGPYSGGSGAGESALQYAGGNVEHIGNGVFETTEDEKHDGEEDRGNFALGGVSTEGHPDGDADQNITKYTTQKSFEEWKAGLSDSGRDDGVGGVVENATQSNNSSDEKSAEKIAKKNEGPILEKFEETDFAVEESHEHEIVASEEFAAGDHNHGEASGEDAGAGDFAAVDVAKSGASGGESDKHAGKDTEQNHLPPFEIGFLFSCFDGFVRDLCRC